jgi:hypothetical protein
MVDKRETVCNTFISYGKAEIKIKKFIQNAKLKVLKAVFMKIQVFWDDTVSTGRVTDIKIGD